MAFHLYVSGFSWPGRGSHKVANQPWYYERQLCGKSVFVHTFSRHTHVGPTVQAVRQRPEILSRIWHRWVGRFTLGCCIGSLPCRQSAIFQNCHVQSLSRLLG